jgi:peptide/nickel transport system permease protein
MTRYILFRLLYAAILLAGTIVITFFMTRMLPGDPIRAAMQQNMDLRDETIVQQVRARYGLDRPVHIQFAMWARDFFTGNWGNSLSSGQKVTEMFRQRLPVTLELFFLSLFWSWLFGIIFGVISALKRNSMLDFTITGVSIAGLSIPVFWEAIILIYVFAVWWKVLPPSGYVPFFEDPVTNLKMVAMPTFVMATHGMAGVARYVRASLLEVVGQDFIRTARAKGLREKRVILGHAFKPAAIPVITIFGGTFAGILSGSFIIELMFAIPGLGRMGLDAIFQRDFPIIQAMAVLGSSCVLLANLVTDLAYGWLDPRVRIYK